MTSVSRLAGLAAALAFSAGGAQAFTLHVLHINDFHSRIEPINAFDATCSADDAAGACFGGAARLHAAIAERRAEAEERGEAVLVLSAGDMFQGSLFFSAYKGRAEAEFMNMAGFDAMVLGNHEFDLGPDPLVDFIKAVEFPVVFGNTDATADPGLAPLDRDPVVVEVGGVRIGIAGAVTEATAEIANPGPTVTFDDALAAIRAQVAAFRAEGIEHIVALTHVGAATDIDIAREVPEIDLVVGGHSHTLFSNTDEDAVHPYPLMVEGSDGDTTPVVHAGDYGKYLGHAVVTFDAAGDVTRVEGDAVLLDASVAPDPDVLAWIEERRGPIEDLMGREIGTVAEDIDGSRESCRAAECEMGNLVADAMLARVRGQGVTIALQNGGGLRASIGAGEVTNGDVIEVLPFQNTLATFNLAGADIIAALENGVSQVEEGAGRFPQVAGLRFEWDPSVPPMEGRIRKVMVEEDGAWGPIDPEKVYSVVSNDFLRGGGDGYTVLRDNARNAYDHGPGLEDVLADYIADNPGYTPYTDGRIRRVE